MGAKCGKLTCCGLWVQHSSPSCCPFEQFSGVGSCEARLPPINGWQVGSSRLAAYALLYFFLFWFLRCVRRVQNGAACKPLSKRDAGLFVRAVRHYGMLSQMELIAEEVGPRLVEASPASR